MRDFAADRKLCEAVEGKQWAVNERWTSPYGEMYMVTVPDIPGQMVGWIFKKAAEFAVNAREGWPAALDRIAEFEAEIESYQQANQRLNNIVTNCDKRIDELEAHNAVLRQALERVRGTLEQGERNAIIALEIACRTLEETPAQAAERVGALVDALRVAKPYLDMAANYDRLVELDVSWKDPVAAQVRNKMDDALAKWEGK